MLEIGRGSWLPIGTNRQKQTEQDSSESYIYAGSSYSQAKGEDISWRKHIPYITDAKWGQNELSAHDLSPSIGHRQNLATSADFQMPESKWAESLSQICLRSISLFPITRRYPVCTSLLFFFFHPVTLKNNFPYRITILDMREDWNYP